MRKQAPKARPLTLKALHAEIVALKVQRDAMIQVMGAQAEQEAQRQKAASEAIARYEQHYQGINGTLWGRLRWLLAGR